MKGNAQLLVGLIAGIINVMMRDKIPNAILAKFRHQNTHSSALKQSLQSIHHPQPPQNYKIDDMPFVLHHQNHNCRQSQAKPDRFRKRIKTQENLSKGNTKFTFFANSLELPASEQFYILRLCHKLQTAKHKIRPKPVSLDLPPFRNPKISFSQPNKLRNKTRNAPRRFSFNSPSPQPAGKSRREELKHRMRVLSREVAHEPSSMPIPLHLPMSLPQFQSK